MIELFFINDVSFLYKSMFSVITPNMANFLVNEKQIRQNLP
jgi:hypothetical protein